LPPTKGRARAAGADAQGRSRALRTTIGYMSQRFTLYGDLTVRENLDLAAGMYNVPEDVRQERERTMLIGLDARLLATRAAALPGGFRQRLALACATLHRPEVIFLDEPTAGVDPLARRRFWERIRGLAAEGATVLVTTHFLDEAEYCDRIGLLLDGRLIALGTPDALKREAIPGSMISVPVSDARRAVDVLNQTPSPPRTAIFGTSLHVTVAPGTDTSPYVAALRAAGLATGEASLIAPTLEDAFIALVQRPRAA
jgi:ABC-2 type transport system ATP-binding protein